MFYRCMQDYFAVPKLLQFNPEIVTLHVNIIILAVNM